MPLRNRGWLLIVPGLVGLGLAVTASAPPPDKDYKLIRQIVDVFAEVDANFYRELSDEEKQQFVEDMINGGLRKLDPHSEFMNAEALKRFEIDSQGSFGGVGILLEIDPKTKFLMVEHPVPGTPAYEAGLIANDLIVAVDGTSTEGLTVPKASERIKGEPGTKVTLTIRRAGQPDQPYTLTRARIEQHPVSGVRRDPTDPNKWDWFIDKPNGIALIHVATFNELTVKELEAAVKEIEAQDGKAIILDLRDNPGGLLDQATKMADLFLTEGKIVGTKDRRNKERVFNAKQDGTLFLPAEQKPLVVLVNGDSASASEIVAAAFQDHKRATIIGERTFGKGSVQKLLRLGTDPPSAVKLTTETWWRPSGANMDRKLVPKDRPDEWGVKPDIEVPMTEDQRRRYVVELWKAHWVAGKPSVVGANPPPTPTPKGPDGKPLVDDSKPFEDPPVNKAVEFLRKKLMGVGRAPAPAAQPWRLPTIGERGA